MAKLTAIKADLDKVEHGVWTRYELGIELLVANINSKPYRRARDAILRPHLRQIRSRQLSNDEIVDLLKPAAAKYLLLGWKNIEDDHGVAIPYSPEMALEMFEDRALHQFYLDVLELAGETDQYRESLLEDAEKNSRPTFPGGSGEAKT